MLCAQIIAPSAKHTRINIQKKKRRKKKKKKVRLKLAQLANHPPQNPTPPHVPPHIPEPIGSKNFTHPQGEINMRKQLFQAEEGKQATLVDVALAADPQTDEKHLVDAGVGIKPIGRSPRGFKVKILDGNLTGKTLLLNPTILVAV